MFLERKFLFFFVVDHSVSLLVKWMTTQVCTSEVADNPLATNSAVLAGNSAGVESDRDIRDEYQLETQEADRVYGHPKI